VAGDGELSCSLADEVSVMAAELVLASSSPRRKELLEQLGVSFKVQAVEVDESALLNEAPLDYVLRVAKLKAEALRFESALPVLAADTAGELEGRLLIKPESREDAINMLEAMSGTTHKVMTAVVLCTAERCEYKVVSSEVTFRQLCREQIVTYCDTGEPFDKAGAYGIQGYGGALVERINGSYSAIVGLPLAETALLLERFGVAYWKE